MQLPMLISTCHEIIFDLTTKKFHKELIVPTPCAEEQAYRVLVQGVKDYVTQTGFSKVTLGLSGGVDSALTMAVAVDALGAENVHAIMMPTRCLG